MQVLKINADQENINYKFSHNKKPFHVRNFNNFISHDSSAIYIVGYVSHLATRNITINNSIIAGVFNNIKIISGFGFYISANINEEYERITIPNIKQPGALSYIDGCNNTELIAPVKLGLPTINYLHVPANVNQTEHHHQSERIGYVAHGSGYAKTNDNIYELSEYQMFILPAGEQHHFFTKDNSLSILVFHPDSDIGPTDETNNMKIRTHITD